LCTKNKKKLCETRWVERVEALADFSSRFEAIIDVLDEISEWEDTNASSQAKTFTSSLTNFEFLISLHCQVSVLDLFFPLIKLFQKISLNVGYARNVIDNLIETLKHIRSNCDSEIAVGILRQTKRQVNRNNTVNSGPEDFYKKTIYISMLDNIMLDIMDRFSNQLTDFWRSTYLFLVI
jgi:hypothetical protein